MDRKKLKVIKFSIDLQIKVAKHQLNVRLLSLPGILVALIVAGVRYALHIIKLGVT